MIGFLDIDRATALHLATALELHAKTCRNNGMRLPPALVDLKCRAWEVARGDHEGPAEPPSDFLDRVTHPATMLLTIPEAAASLRLSERKVKRLVANGTIPSVLIDSARRIRCDDLAAYVDSLGPRSFRGQVETKISTAGVVGAPAGATPAGVTGPPPVDPGSSTGDAA